MIITDIKRLREVPIGEVVTLVMEIKVVETSLNYVSPCSGCAFTPPGCDHCNADSRFDGKEVKFLKI